MNKISYLLPFILMSCSLDLYCNTLQGHKDKRCKGIIEEQNRRKEKERLKLYLEDRLAKIDVEQNRKLFERFILINFFNNLYLDNNKEYNTCLNNFFLKNLEKEMPSVDLKIMYISYDDTKRKYICSDDCMEIMKKISNDTEKTCLVKKLNEPVTKANIRDVIAKTTYGCEYEGNTCYCIDGYLSKNLSDNDVNKLVDLINSNLSWSEINDKWLEDFHIRKKRKDAEDYCLM